MKLSNKVILVLCLPEKSSFTLSKLRFFGLRKPKNPSCYTTSTRNEVARQTCWTTSFSFTATRLGSLLEVYGQFPYQAFPIGPIFKIGSSARRGCGISILAMSFS